MSCGACCPIVGEVGRWGGEAVWRVVTRQDGKDSVWRIAGDLTAVMRANYRNEIVACRPIDILSIERERDL